MLLEDFGGALDKTKKVVPACNLKSCLPLPPQVGQSDAPLVGSEANEFRVSGGGPGHDQVRPAIGASSRQDGGGSFLEEPEQRRRQGNGAWCYADPPSVPDPPGPALSTAEGPAALGWASSGQVEGTSRTIRVPWFT